MHFRDDNVANPFIDLQPKYASLLKRLFPKGWAWNFGDQFNSLIQSLAYEPARLEARTLDFMDELDPRTTFEMLDNWERLLQIPDECTPAGDPSIFERRVRVLQKLTTGGGQSITFYKLIAQQLGYDVSVVDVKNYKDFRAGFARAGDELTNSTNPDGSVSDAGWVYTWQLKGPAALVRYFRAGQGTAGQPLVLFSNDTLECVIKKYSPAHTTVLFNFGE